MRRPIIITSTATNTIISTISSISIISIALLLPLPVSSFGTFPVTTISTRTGNRILAGSLSNPYHHHKQYHYQYYHHLIPTTTTATTKINMSPTSTSTNTNTSTDSNSMLPRKIVIVGSSNQDLTAYVHNTFPSPGETIMGQQFQISPGGKGANQGKNNQNNNY